VRAKEAKALAKKAKKAKGKVQAAESQDKSTSTTDELPSALAGTKANAVGNDNNAGGQRADQATIQVARCKVSHSTVFGLSVI